MQLRECLDRLVQDDRFPFIRIGMNVDTVNEANESRLLNGYRGEAGEVCKGRVAKVSYRSISRMVGAADAGPKLFNWSKKPTNLCPSSRLSGNG